MRWQYLLVCIFLCRFSQSAGQQPVILHVSFSRPGTEKIPENLPTEFENEASVEFALNRSLQEFYREGFLLAAWQKHGVHGDTIKVTVDSGPRITWAKLTVSDDDKPWLEAAGIKTNSLNGKPYRHTQVGIVLNEILDALNQRGYPFAQVSLDSVEFADSVLSAKLLLKKNTFIQFDSVIVIGSLQVSQNYLSRYTGIVPDMPWQQSLVDALPARMRQCTFATMNKPPVVEFNGNRARILLYADERKVSRFDFLLGVLPNNAITGRLIITGDLQLQLQNVFSQGEQIGFRYNKLESTSKSVDVDVVYPYLPGLSIGPQAGFYLYLKDSTFLERRTEGALNYQISGNHTLKGLAVFSQSSVLRPDTNFVLNNYSLPSMLDVRDRSYGLEWQLVRVNDVLNPRKGFSATIAGLAGTRTILENASIVSLQDPDAPEFDFSTLYDSIELSGLSLRYSYDLQYFIPFLRQFTILVQARGAALLYDNLTANELIRVGGNSLLRGFDEQSIPVSTYQIGTVELRYLLGARSYAALFGDAGYLRNSTLNTMEIMYPYGFGAGLRFETKAGIFGLSYALGGTSTDPVAVRNTKVHFGYINYF